MGRNKAQIVFLLFIFLAVEDEMPNQKSFDLKGRRQKNEESLEIFSEHGKEFSLMEQEYIGHKHFEDEHLDPNRRTGT